MSTATQEASVDPSLYFKHISPTPPIPSENDEHSFFYLDNGTLDNTELVYFYQDTRSSMPQCRESAPTAPTLKCEKPLTAELQGRQALGTLKINK